MWSCLKSVVYSFSGKKCIPRLYRPLQIYIFTIYLGHILISYGVKNLVVYSKYEWIKKLYFCWNISYITKFKMECKVLDDLHCVFIFLWCEKVLNFSSREVISHARKISMEGGKNLNSSRNGKHTVNHKCVFQHLLTHKHFSKKGEKILKDTYFCFVWFAFLISFCNI